MTASRMNQLRNILSESIEAYELAKISSSRSSQIAEAEEARASDLVALADNVDRRAQQLLEKAGLAYISGAPLAIEANPERVRRPDEEIADAFTAAQTALSNLRVELLQLALALLEVNRLDEAIQVASAVSNESTEAVINTAVDLIVRAQARQLQGYIREIDLAAIVKWRNWLIENGEHREVKPLSEQLVGLAGQLNSNDKPRDALVLYELLTLVPGWGTAEIDELRENSVRSVIGAAIEAKDDETLLHHQDWIETHGEKQGLSDAIRMLHDRLLRDAIKSGNLDTARQQLDRVKNLGNVSLAARNLIFQEPELMADYLGVKWIVKGFDEEAHGVAVSPSGDYVATFETLISFTYVRCYRVVDAPLLTLYKIGEFDFHNSYYAQVVSRDDCIHFSFYGEDRIVFPSLDGWTCLALDPSEGIFESLSETGVKAKPRRSKQQQLIDTLAPYCALMVQGSNLEILSYTLEREFIVRVGSHINDIDVADDCRYLFLACNNGIGVLDISPLTQNEAPNEPATEVET